MKVNWKSLLNLKLFTGQSPAGPVQYGGDDDVRPNDQSDVYVTCVCVCVAQHTSWNTRSLAQREEARDVGGTWRWAGSLSALRGNSIQPFSERGRRINCHRWRRPGRICLALLVRLSPLGPKKRGGRGVCWQLTVYASANIYLYRRPTDVCQRSELAEWLTVCLVWSCWSQHDYFAALLMLPV